MRIITKNIWILSFVSLLADIAGEMLYPVLPMYLSSIGFSVVLIGVMEGVSDGIAGLSKGYFGNWSDNIGKRLPFVRVGYLLTAFSKPLMIVFANPIWVFFTRILDRLGKGVRTGARDALLSEEAAPETKGRVFSFHRAIETVGSAIGPLLALLYLWFYPGDYFYLFLLAFFPGIVAIIFTLLVKESPKAIAVIKTKTRFLDFFRYWKTSPVAYRRIATALLVFALFNCSDVFLLLKMQEAGYSSTETILVYVFYNVVFAAAAYPFGVLADKIGMKKVFVLGLIFYAGVYFTMAFANHILLFFVAFFAYGLYAAATEGIAKAWISNVCEKDKIATAIGTYTAFQSVAALVASSFTGLLWYYSAPWLVFVMIGTVAVAVALYLFFRSDASLITHRKVAEIL